MIVCPCVDCEFCFCQKANKRVVASVDGQNITLRYVGSCTWEATGSWEVYCDTATLVRYTIIDHPPSDRNTHLRVYNGSNQLMRSWQNIIPEGQMVCNEAEWFMADNHDDEPGAICSETDSTTISFLASCCSCECESSSGNVECPFCSGTTPPQVQVDLSGIVDGSASCCSGCSGFNGSFVLDYAGFVLTPTPTCRWVYNFPDAVCDTFGAVQSQLVFTLAWTGLGGGGPILRKTVGLFTGGRCLFNPAWYTEASCPAPCTEDCVAIDDDLPIVGFHNNCDSTGSTCHVTAL